MCVTSLAIKLVVVSCVCPSVNADIGARGSDLTVWKKREKYTHTHTRTHSNPLGKADNENQFQFERETDREEMR